VTLEVCLIRGKLIKGKFKMKLWDTLSEGNKKKLAQCYEQLTGKKWTPPKRDSMPIQIESLRELDKLMKEKPGQERK